jgi:LacI family transcriptional regulator
MPEQVNEASRRKVRDAIEALRYVPHAAARALASRRSHLIGAVIPTAAHSIFGGFIESLENALFDVGYALLLANFHYAPEREVQQAEHLVTRGVEAMVLVGGTHREELYQCLNAGGVPYVNTWLYSPDAPHPCIGFDNVATARTVTSYLIGLGHERFAMIAGDSKRTDRAAERVVGVRQTLEDHGLVLPPECVIERPYDVGEGRDAMHQLMSRVPRPTAVICGNDVLAFGAACECRALGIDVPSEVSITGFDDLEIASQLDPALTTVSVPAAAMGRRAADYLLATLAGEAVPTKSRLNANLVVRGTTAAPPQGNQTRLPLG